MKALSRFDEAAAQWDNNQTRVALAQAVGTAIRRKVPIQPHWRALDFGAGTGLLSLNLQPHVASLTAVDSSKGMLGKLTEKITASGIQNVQTRHWNLDERAFPEANFDLVVSSMTLHHVRDLPSVLTRLAELLKPGGWLAVADLDREDGSFHGEAPDVFHHGFERSQVSHCLAEAGLSAVSICDAHTITKPAPSGEMRTYGVFLATARKGCG